MVGKHDKFRNGCLSICAALALYGSCHQAGASEILVLGLFKDMAIIKVDNTQHKLRPGQSTPQGVKLIAADSEEAILEINGVRRSYGLGNHQGMASFESVKTITKAQIWADQGMYKTSGQINGQPVDMLVDTGASTVAMNTEQAQRLGINYRYVGRKGMAQTASGVVNTWQVKLNSVKVGEIELQNVEGAVVEGNGPTTILLGMSFLKHVQMHREGNMLLLQQKR